MRGALTIVDSFGFGMPNNSYANSLDSSGRSYATPIGTIVMSATSPMKSGSNAIDSSPIFGGNALQLRLRVPSIKNSTPVW